VLNAITPEVLEALTVAFDSAAGDPAIRAIVITGAGRAFCSGQDLSAGAAAGGADVETMLREHYHPLITTMRSVDQPVIAAVNGVAAGAGVSLALAADLRLAAASATFVQAFVRIGLIPDAGSTYFLPRLVGPARAAELMLLGDTLDSATAERIGLVSRVVADDRLLDSALELAGRLASGPRSVQLIKRALRASPGNDLEAQLRVEEQLQGEATRTADFPEGIAAFREKRQPSFSGS